LIMKGLFHFAKPRGVLLTVRISDFAIFGKLGYN
jgi:hypothetical protein